MDGQPVQFDVNAKDKVRFLVLHGRSLSYV